MNLENQNKNSTSRKSSYNVDKKHSNTPQPTMKNISNDMTKIIENEISQIGDSKNPQAKKGVYFFGVIYNLINF